MTTITIPRTLTRKGDLVVVPRKEYERMLSLAAQRSSVTAADILRWSKESKQLKRIGRLPLLRSLADLR